MLFLMLIMPYALRRQRTYIRNIMKRLSYVNMFV